MKMKKWKREKKQSEAQNKKDSQMKEGEEKEKDPITHTQESNDLVVI